MERPANLLAPPDLYLKTRPEAAGDALGRFFDLLAYVADRGQPIPSGDTIGATDDERIPVEYVRSPSGDGSTVWAIQL